MSTSIQQKGKTMHHLMPLLEDRAAFPLAVQIKRPDSARPVVFHYSNRAAAEFLTDLMTDAECEVRYFVANLDPHVLHSAAVGVGWYEVGSFDPDGSAEVRAVLAWLLDAQHA